MFAQDQYLSLYLFITLRELIYHERRWAGKMDEFGP